MLHLVTCSGPSQRHSVWRRIGLFAIIATALASAVVAQTQTASNERSPAAAADFPPELVHWSPRPENPIFTAEGPGHWDVKIRERGWILREKNTFELWFTGYDGTRQGLKLLGY